ncbi:MAG: SDR family NAD(P)-dependent oxidoreductase [Rubripirellula sp.]
MSPKQIVVVGGSHGIGFGIVQRCLAAGDRVTVLSRTSSELAECPAAQHHALDVTTDDIPSDVLPETIDGLVYCPGSIHLGPVRGVKADQLRKDFELNVVGAVKSLQASLGGLKRAPAASVVMFSTVAVATGLPMHTSVAASKGAIEALTRTWAAELSPQIRVNAVAPALTDTPLAARFLDQGDKRKAMSEKYPLKRIGTVDDIAATASFLLSDQSGWITGQVLAVDGGMSSILK